MAETWLTILLNACDEDVPEVLLVTADEGGVKGAELFEVFLPPVRLIELPGVAAGILAAEVKGPRSKVYIGKYTYITHNHTCTTQRS